MRKALFSALVLLGASSGVRRTEAGPVVPIPARTTLDVCRERIERGPRKLAIEVCRETMINDGTPASVGAMVRALMSGDERPTTDDLGMASMMARALRRRAPDTIFGAVAECDIASKLRDIGALEACRDELARRVPGHAEVGRAGAEIEALRTPARVWIAWGALALACVAAIGHALFRFFGSRGPSVKKGAALAAALVVMHSFASVARADEPLKSQDQPAPSPGDSGGKLVTSQAEKKGLSQWAIDPASPEKSVPTPAQRDKNPLEYGYFIQDLIVLAQRAANAGNHREAVKYFRAVAKAAPERSIAFTRLCDEYEALGELDNAIAACRMAIARPGAAPKDYDDFIRLAFARPGKLHPELAMDLEDVVTAFRRNPDTKSAAERINCELGARTRNVKRLEACVATLGAASWNDPKALTYRWVLALERKNYGEAEALVTQASKTKMTPAGVERMRAATLAAEPFLRRYLGTWQRVVSALALLLVGVGLLIAMRRGGKPRGAAPTPQSDVENGGSAPTTA